SVRKSKKFETPSASRPKTRQRRHLQTAANVNEGVTAASVAVDFAIGSSFNSLSSGSSPRSVAADNTATSQDEQCLSVSASQNSSLLSLGAAASTA
uniref:E3 ubiquitin-protein ligase TRIP12 n=1 Tax=Macrostomum lignano TaxID=282301 RepID=A0A1I8FGK2_9PLAT